MRRIVVLAVIAVCVGTTITDAHEEHLSTTPEDNYMPADAMSSRHMIEEPHLRLTALQSPASGDQMRAAEILATLRRSIEKYRDVRVAERDGYKIYLPQIPQPMYHFTNWEYGREAQTEFDPARPTSLMYEKTRDGYRLVGAMYTAPARFAEEQLNARIPLSVGQWHAHVNICRPPQGQERKWFGRQFGLRGSITTREACEMAGGRFIPQLFGWMLHVWPFESDPRVVWAAHKM